MAKENNEKKAINKKEETAEKIGFFARIKRFLNGVKKESKRIHWTTKKDLIKYSIATLSFVIFFSLFFYLVNVVFAYIHTLIG